jgi:hypothetical protein
VQSPPTMYPQPQGWHQRREATVRRSASRRIGARVDGMVSRCERSINTVRSNKPKMLTGLRQHGNAVGTQVVPSWVMGIQTAGE